jgi:hypothetical protein
MGADRDEHHRRGRHADRLRNADRVRYAGQSGADRHRSSDIVYDGSITGAGTFDIGTGSDVTFNGSVAQQQTIAFTDNTGTLTLGARPVSPPSSTGSSQATVSC